jgi:hypothetical protein
MFRRITRYPVTYASNPRENRLTEVTAAVIDQVGHLAGPVVEHLLASGIEDGELRHVPGAEAERRCSLRSVSRGLIVSRLEVNTQRHGHP